MKDLVGKEIAPQKGLDKVESELAIAQAKLKGLKSKLQLLGIGYRWMGEKITKKLTEISVNIEANKKGITAEQEVELRSALIDIQMVDINEVIDSLNAKIDELPIIEPALEEVEQEEIEEPKVEEVAEEKPVIKTFTDLKVELSTLTAEDMAKKYNKGENLQFLKTIAEKVGYENKLPTLELEITKLIKVLLR